MKSAALKIILCCILFFPLQAHALELDANNFTTLNDAMLKLKASDDTSCTVLISETIMINGDYTIKGGGKSLTLKRASGFLGDLFYVSKGAKLTLENLTIDGNSERVKTSKGALIYNEGTVNARTGVKLQNNKRINSSTGAANGGALTNLGSFSMKNGEITNNSSQTGGGGIFNFGGRVSLSGDLVISGNYAKMGGAICNTDNSELSISSNVVISENDAQSGGGVMNAGSKAKLNISGKTAFKSNTADYGSAIMNAGALRLSGAVRIGENDEDNGIYIGMFQNDGTSFKSTIAASLKEGARVNLEGGINHEGDGLILIFGRSYRSSAKYLFCTNPAYKLETTQRGSLVLTQRSVEIIKGEGYEKSFRIEGKKHELKSVTLNYKLTENLQYSVEEKSGYITVTLKGSFLQRLGDKSMFIRFDFSDNKAECVFMNTDAP